ncbi:CDP-glycerol glycerophosphotransferase family protein [Turicibacter sanguinis]|uniref:CDP-glycerol glycerophosphotransferase family protein n=1 Tax=Turicibacter sanguinis TaxID=154288 RepID=UPI001898651A|nr:CDP-glycerol glycerophosphotransferase family protein [Turicibacter sanguinis]
MKEIIFNCFNFIYKIFCMIFKIKENRIVLECDYGKGFYGNLHALYTKIQEENLKYEIIIPVNKNIVLNLPNSTNTKIIRTKTVQHLFYLSTSKFWITNNHYYYFLSKRKETIFINTWHALGAFKKFGLDCNDGKEAHHLKDGKNIDFLLVSSKKLKNIYSKALNVELEKIISIGIPRVDVLFNPIKRKEIKKNLEERLQCLPKKIILYAPTFRDHEKIKFDLKLDLEEMFNSLGEEYVLLIKLHPIIRTKIVIEDKYSDFVKDVSNFNMNELLIYSDILITDYSSVIFEFSLLEKPIIFFSYDLHNFKEKSRSFYVDYESFIPDNPVFNTKEVIEKILFFRNEETQTYIENIKKFADKYCDFKDSESCSRFIEKFL